MNARVTYVQAPEGMVEKGLKLWYENVLPVTMARGRFSWRSLASRSGDRQGAVDHILGHRGELAREHQADYHREAVARYGEFFESAHEPENYVVDIATGPMFTS